MATQTQRRHLIVLLAMCLALSAVLGVIAFRITRRASPDVTLAEFWGLRGFSALGVFVGMISGIVFGAIDNGGLFFGMDALDPFLPKGELVRAGLGDTFSNVVGSVASVFVGIIVREATGFEGEYPIWSLTLGMLIGCLLGVYVPHYITKKQ